MKQALHIAAIFDEPELMQNLVEKLAYRRHDAGFCNEKVPDGSEALETSSTEAYVSGTVILESDDAETVRMPFITCFMFTCIKAAEEPYQLSWSFSLS